MPRTRRLFGVELDAVAAIPHERKMAAAYSFELQRISGICVQIQRVVSIVPLRSAWIRPAAKPRQCFVCNQSPTSRLFVQISIYFVLRQLGGDGSQTAVTPAWPQRRAMRSGQDCRRAAHRSEPRTGHINPAR